ncbi:hypothetical protein ACSNOI_05120, partial [Actinomadura kijaniata]|uniref:hypothetical protein n=1 Tax=Actinomadura kijaniata TaxID=46161 RepID=UPI003F1B4704
MATAGPLGTMKGPQVAMPPVAGPQLAGQPLAMVFQGRLRAAHEETSPVDDAAAVGAGTLAAGGTSLMLVLLWRRLGRRGLPPVRRADLLQLRLQGKRVTRARLRALPPRPARTRLWIPVRAHRAVRP